MANLTSEDFDDMHHAIGRKGIKGAYRNYYCTPVGGRIAMRFEETGCWDLMRTIKQNFDPQTILNPGCFLGGI